MKKSIVLLFALAVVAGCASSQHSPSTLEAERQFEGRLKGNPYGDGTGGLRPSR